VAARQGWADARSGWTTTRWWGLGATTGVVRSATRNAGAVVQIPPRLQTVKAVRERFELRAIRSSVATSAPGRCRVGKAGRC